MLLNKIVMITGASAGFGEATAHTFAREGAKLILIARRKNKLDSLAKELNEKYKTEVITIELDVSDAKDATAKLDNLPPGFETPDILINNAGLVHGLKKIWETSPAENDEMIDINVKGILNISRMIIPRMLKKNQGHIVNVSSISGHQTYPGGGIYCATKHAVRALTDTLRMELVDTPLRVSMISPGIAKTEFSLVRFDGDQEAADRVYEGLEPLNANDIAESLLFIVSRPPHVTVADLILLPTHQANVSLVHRNN